MFTQASTTFELKCRTAVFLYFLVFKPGRAGHILQLSCRMCILYPCRDPISIYTLDLAMPAFLCHCIHSCSCSSNSSSISSSNSSSNSSSISSSISSSYIYWWCAAQNQEFLKKTSYFTLKYFACSIPGRIHIWKLLLQGVQGGPYVVWRAPVLPGDRGLPCRTDNQWWAEHSLGGVTWR